MQSVLCVMPGSNYYLIDGLDLWDKERDAYNYKGTGRVICHPPCQQWSKLKAFSKDDIKERELAYWCYELVNKYGGIMEHPKGSSFFKTVGADTRSLRVVWQSWWGFRAKKETYLYCRDVDLLSYPLSFDAIKMKVENMNKKERSKMPLEFCKYLVNSVCL